MTQDQQLAARRMGLEDGVQSRVRYAEREWIRRRKSRVRKQREQVSSTTARAVWWGGARYDTLGEDGHSAPPGGRLLPRESESAAAGRVLPDA